MALSGSIKTNSYEGRYYKLSWEATQSIAHNTTTISWKISCSGGSASWYAERELKAVIDGTTVYSKSSRVERKTGTIKSGVITIEHDTYGVKNDVKMSLRVACYTATVNLTASNKFDLDAIPRLATITTAPNFTDEDNPAITYSNPAGTAVEALQVCISFDKTAQNIAYRDVSKTGNSYTFNFTAAERAVLYNGTTTANSRTVYFYIKTTIGGENFYSSLAKTLTIANCQPSLNPTLEDVNYIQALPNNLPPPTGDVNNIFIKGWSNVSYATGAVAKKGATIVSQSVKCGGKSSTTASGTLNSVESATFVFTATDSRGNTVSKTLNKTLINYYKPTGSISIDAKPITDNGELTFTISGKFFNGSFGAENNAIKMLSWHLTDNGTTVAIKNNVATEIKISGNSFTYTTTVSGLSYKKNYSIYTLIKDSLGSKYEITEKVITMPLFDWGKDDFRFNVPVEFAAGATGAGDSGEWKPALQATAITSYTNQKGWYQKSGKVITAGFYIKATCKSGYETTGISISGLPFNPSITAAGGGMCSGAYVSSGFTFQCWAAGTDGKITARVQQVNHTTATNLATSASGCFYRKDGGEITISGTITYITA